MTVISSQDLTDGAVGPLHPIRVLRRRGTVAAVSFGWLAAEIVIFRDRVAGAVTGISRVDPWWLLVAVGATAASMGGFARAQRRMLATGGVTVSMRRMLAAVYTANALNWTLPGGSALSAAFLWQRWRSWGATAGTAAFALTAGGVLSSATFAVICLAAALTVDPHAAASAAVAGAAVTSGMVAAVFVRRRPHGATLVAARCARVLDRIVVTVRASLMGRARKRGTARGGPASGSGYGLEDFVSRMASDLRGVSPRRRDWSVGVTFAMVNWLADLACLLACARAVYLHGASVPLLVVSWIVGAAAASVSLVPGGIGIVDVAMVAVLTAGGLHTVGATTAVVLYRAISCLLVVAVGWVACAVGRGVRTSQLRRGGGVERPRSSDAEHA